MPSGLMKLYFCMPFLTMLLYFNISEEIKRVSIIYLQLRGKMMAVKQHIPAHNSLGILYLNSLPSVCYLGPDVFYHALLLFKELQHEKNTPQSSKVFCVHTVIFCMNSNGLNQPIFVILIFKHGYYCQEAVYKWFFSGLWRLLMSYSTQFTFTVIFLFEQSRTLTLSRHGKNAWWPQQ